jgi:hypothetical protein
VRKRARAFIVRKQDGDGLVGESAGEQVVNRSLCGRGRGIDTEYGDVLAGHGVLLYINILLR